MLIALHRLLTLLLSLFLGGLWSFPLPPEVQEKLQEIKKDAENVPQQAQRSPLRKDPRVESVELHSVRIPFSVVRKGRYVGELPQELFRVYVDKEKKENEIPITSFQSKDEPISLVATFDISDSMTEPASGQGGPTKLEVAKNAFIKFVSDRGVQEDEFAVVVFDEVARLAFDEFTPSAAQALNVAGMISSLNRKTAVFDGILKAIQVLEGLVPLPNDESGTKFLPIHARNPRKAVFLFTDGQDNSSAATHDDVMEFMWGTAEGQGNIQLYIIGFPGLDRECALVQKGIGGDTVVRTFRGHISCYNYNHDLGGNYPACKDLPLGGDGISGSEAGGVGVPRAEGVDPNQRPGMGRGIGVPGGFSRGGLCIQDTGSLGFNIKRKLALDTGGLVFEPNDVQRLGGLDNVFDIIEEHLRAQYSIVIPAPPEKDYSRKKKIKREDRERKIFVALKDEKEIRAEIEELREKIAGAGPETDPQKLKELQESLSRLEAAERKLSELGIRRVRKELEIDYSKRYYYDQVPEGKMPDPPQGEEKK